ncbi:MAG: hypothetical protein WBK18_07010 [Thermacetogeniaceae bacterium]
MRPTACTCTRTETEGDVANVGVYYCLLDHCSGGILFLRGWHLMNYSDFTFLILEKLKRE